MLGKTFCIHILCSIQNIYIYVFIRQHVLCSSSRVFADPFFGPVLVLQDLWWDTANDMTQTGSFGLSRAAKKRAGAPEPASNSLLLKMAIEIVDLPKKWWFSIAMFVYQRGRFQEISENLNHSQVLLLSWLIYANLWHVRWGWNTCRYGKRKHLPTWTLSHQS